MGRANVCMSRPGSGPRLAQWPEAVGGVLKWVEATAAALSDNNNNTTTTATATKAHTHLSFLAVSPSLALLLGHLLERRRAHKRLLTDRPDGRPTGGSPRGSRCQTDPSAIRRIRPGRPRETAGRQDGARAEAMLLAQARARRPSKLDNGPATCDGHMHCCRSSLPRRLPPAFKT
jgi:hypothetical protein